MKSEWISVKIKMPERDADVLVVNDHRKSGGPAAVKIDRWISATQSLKTSSRGYWAKCTEVSFWMPLPAIPEMVEA